MIIIIIIIKRLKIIFLSVHILHARFVSQWLVAKPYCACGTGRIGAHDLRWSSSGWLDRWQQVTYRGTADFIRIDIPTFTDRPTRTRARSNSRLYTIIHIGCRYIRNIIIIILYYFFFVSPRLTWAPPQVENGPGSRRTTAAAAMYTRAHNIIIIPIILYGHAFIGDYRSTNCNGSNMHIYRYNNNNK